MTPSRFCSPVIALQAFSWADTSVSPYVAGDFIAVVSKERSESTSHLLILFVEETKFSLFEH